MGLWLHAEVAFKDDVFVKTKTSPVNIVKAAFKEHGLDVDAPYSELRVTQASRCSNVSVAIADPDCHVDEIHNTFKYLTKRKDSTRCIYIHIQSHYY